MAGFKRLVEGLSKTRGNFTEKVNDSDLYTGG